MGLLLCTLSFACMTASRPVRSSRMICKAHHAASPVLPDPKFLHATGMPPTAIMLTTMGSVSCREASNSWRALCRSTSRLHNSVMSTLFDFAPPRLCEVMLKMHGDGFRVSTIQHISLPWPPNLITPYEQSRVPPDIPVSGVCKTSDNAMHVCFVQTHCTT
jgi:hypothetical protein